MKPFGLSSPFFTSGPVNMMRNPHFAHLRMQTLKRLNTPLPELLSKGSKRGMSVSEAESRLRRLTNKTRRTVRRGMGIAEAEARLRRLTSGTGQK